jgi:hypothetical protein
VPRKLVREVAGVFSIRNIRFNSKSRAFWVGVSVISIRTSIPAVVAVVPAKIARMNSYEVGDEDELRTTPKKNFLICCICHKFNVQSFPRIFTLQKTCTSRSTMMLRMQNILLVLLAASSSASAVNVAEGSEGGLTVELMSKWKLWTDAHGKTYDSHEHKMERLQVWSDNEGT